MSIKDLYNRLVLDLHSLKIPVEEGDHIVITFSSLGGDIIYNAFSIIDNIQVLLIILFDIAWLL